MTVSGFFDESGKFKDRKVISMGGVASFQGEFVNFGHTWARLLKMNGMTEFAAKVALNPRKPLGKKNDSLGIEKRIEDLLPFIACIRKHLQVITGIAIDVQAFQKLPPHFFQFFGTTPYIPRSLDLYYRSWSLRIAMTKLA